jgi:hypothetical protein
VCYLDLPRAFAQTPYCRTPLQHATPKCDEMGSPRSDDFPYLPYLSNETDDGTVDFHLYKHVSKCTAVRHPPFCVWLNEYRASNNRQQS